MKHILAVAGLCLVITVCVLVAYRLGQPRYGGLEPTEVSTSAETDAVRTDPGSYVVSPTTDLELAELIESFERDVPPDVELESELALRKRDMLAAKERGYSPFRVDWMKDPDYYRDLETPQLARECFAPGPTIAVFFNEMEIFDSHRFALLRLEVFHNGFAELFKRADRWKGLLAAYEYLASNIDPNLSSPESVQMTGGALHSMQYLYGCPPFKEQIKGRERLFLAANVRVLKKYKQWLNMRPAGDARFFGEPIVVAKVALMLLKQVDLQGYAEAESVRANVRFREGQNKEDLKTYINLAVASLDRFVSELDAKQLDETLSKGASRSEPTNATEPLSNTVPENLRDSK